MRIRSMVIAAVALAAGVSVAPVTAPSASAACDSGAPAAYWSDSDSQTVVYGETWYFQAVDPATYTVIGPWTGTASISGADAYQPFLSTYTDFDQCTTYVSIAAGGGRPLPVGEYTISAEITSVAGETHDPGDARLAITPAELGIAGRIVADPSNPRNAIVTAAFTGAFAETYRNNWASATTASAPLTPAGTWMLEVRDASGQVVLQVSKERTEEDDAFALSSYWLEPAPGVYELTTRFQPAGPNVGNFTITEAAPFSFTVAAVPGIEPTATPAPTAPPQVIAAEGPVLPPWIFIASGALSAGLLAVMIVQLVRRGRSARTATGPLPADGVAQ